MKMLGRGRRLMLLLTSGILAVSLTACVPPARTDCSWVKPIYLQDETLQWLDTHQPWPESVWEDLNKIAKHNDKVKEILNP